MKNIRIFLLIVILIACKSDEKIDFKRLLTDNQWEQMIGTVDGQYVALKMFYRMDFKTDNSVEIEWSYGGTPSEFDPPPLNNHILTRYELDEEARTISFPQNLDTLQIEYPLGTISTNYVRLNKMKILSIKPERLDVEFSNSSLTSDYFLLGYGKAYFQPLKGK
jgi:hypothetical protein